MSRIGSSLASALALSLALGCGDEPDPDPTPMPMPTPVTFAEDIHPLLQLKCGASDCHAIDRPPFQPGHAAPSVMDAYEATQAVGSMNAPVYERILIRVTSEVPGVMMPPTFANPPCQGELGTPGCLTVAEVELLQAWVDQGAPL